MSSIDEIEKRMGESRRHMLLVRPGIMEAFYHGKADAFEEAIDILKEVKE